VKQRAELSKDEYLALLQAQAQDPPTADQNAFYTDYVATFPKRPSHVAVQGGLFRQIRQWRKTQLNAQPRILQDLADFEAAEQLAMNGNVEELRKILEVRGKAAAQHWMKFFQTYKGRGRPRDADYDAAAIKKQESGCSVVELAKDLFPNQDPDNARDKTQKALARRRKSQK
jgi:hypothetical protein